MSPWILLLWIPFLLLIAVLPSHWDGNGGLLNDKRIKLQEKRTARLVAEIENKENRESRPTHKARRLHDGIEGSKKNNVPIKELMEGFKGVL